MNFGDMIEIKDISGKVLFSVLLNENSKFVEELMTSDYIQLSWVSDKGDILPVGAYIEYEGEKYRLLEPYKPQQTDEATYNYTPQFQSRVMGWGKQLTPIYTYEEDGTTVKSREMDWTFTGSPADAMFIVKQAIKNETGEDWTIQLSDSLPATITISAQSSTILATLSSMAQECNTEFWADKKTNTLYLSQCIFGEAITLTVGENVQVPTITNSNEGYFTRFYAFGSTRNIPQTSVEGEANVNKRLTLDPAKYPYGYKDIREGLKEGEIFPTTLYFDDIYPSSKLTISDVRARLRYRLDNNGNRIQVGGTDEKPIYEQYAIWYFQIAGFTFDTTSTIEGLNLSVSFESGQLNGRDFELTYHDKAETARDANDVTPFEIKAGDYEIIIDETSGQIIPGTSYIIPHEGDMIVLYNIKMPAEYTSSAQLELEEALNKAIAKQLEDNNTYNTSSNPVQFYNENIDLQMGRSVNFVYLGKTLQSRIMMIEKRLDLPCYQSFSVGSKVLKGNTQQLKEEVANVNQNIDIIKAFNDLSNSLSQAYANAQREMIEGFAAIKNLWQLKQDDEGNYYAYTEYDVLGKKGITAYSDGSGSGGSGGGGIDVDVLWEILGGTDTQQINVTHLTDALTWNNISSKPTTLSGYGITDAYTKTDSDNRFVNVSGDTMTGDLSTKRLTSTDLFIDTGDATLKIYSGYNPSVGNSDGNICFQTSFDRTDGQNHEYPTGYPSRCNILLQPRGGQVYIGINPNEGDPHYKLFVNGRIYSTAGFIKENSSDSYLLLGGGGHKAISDFMTRKDGAAPDNADYGFGYWENIGSYISFAASGWGGQLRAQGNTLYYRYISNNKPNAWQILAKITDNVASATKLQTARTIWGQSFDGTGNVNGSLTIDNSDIVGYGGAKVLQNLSGNLGINPLYNVGIGTTSPLYKLDVAGTMRVTGAVTLNNTLSVDSTSTFGNNVTFSGTERCDITTSYRNDGSITNIGDSVAGIRHSFNFKWYDTEWYIGNIRSGSVTSLGFGVANGNKCYLRVNTDTTTVYGNILATGGITCYSSDQRAKTVIEQIRLSLKQIANAPTIRFKWNDWKIKDDGKTHIGGIAQYMQKLLPETVLEADDMLNLDYATTGYIFAVQTAKHLVETDTEVERLKKRVKKLEKQLKQLGHEEANIISD